MGRVILLIGRLCCGKTTYAAQVIREEGAVLISADELMQTIFPEPLGDMYDVYSRRGMAYLFRLTRTLAEGGSTPILDFGFWTRASRAEARELLAGLELDWRYLDVPHDEWMRRIERRNAAISRGEGRLNEYFVDDGLLEKLNSRFQPPEADEGLNMTLIHC